MWNHQLEWVKDMHEPVNLVNPIVELQVFHRFTIFISRFWSLGEPIGAMSGSRDVNKSEVK